MLEKDPATETLQFALEAAQVGAWEWNVRTGEIAWSDNLASVFGMLPSAFGNTFDSFIALIHPDDRAAVERAVMHALEERCSFDCGFRTSPPEGGVQWTLSRGTVFCDEAGAPLRIVGIAMDTTERREAEEQRRRIELQLAGEQAARVERRTLSGGCRTSWRASATGLSRWTGNGATPT